MSTSSNVFTTGSVTLLSAGVSIPLPFHEFLQELEVEISAGGSWTAQMRLFDRESDTLEKLIIAAGKDRDIDFQWGWDDINEPFQRVFNGSIIQYEPEFMPHGILLNMDIISRSAFQQVIDKKIRSFQEGLTISEIVQRIADDRGWVSVIEASDGKSEQPFNTKGESDLNFILKTLLPHAVNVNGSDFISRFDEGDVFHFHSPTYQGGTPLSQHSYRYAREVSGEVIAFIPKDTQMFGTLFGGGNSLYTSPNSNVGGQEQQQTDQATGLGGVGAPAAVDASSQADFGPGIHSYNNVTARDPKEVERLTKARYAEMRRHTFNANLRVHGTHRARVLDYINVDYTKTDGTPHYLSGNFHLFGIKHVVGTGTGWTTEFEMTRQGITQLPGSKPIVASQTITPSAGGGQDEVTINT